MALCLEDGDERIAEMAKLFFCEFRHKNQGMLLYNLLPDMIGRLSAAQLEEAKYRRIIRFVFSFIDKAKQTDGLVDKFCQVCAASYSSSLRLYLMPVLLFSSSRSPPLIHLLRQRFRATDDQRQWRDIAFCLSNLNFSDKGVKRLCEEANFKVNPIPFPLLSQRLKLPSLQAFADKLFDEDICSSFALIVSKARKLPKAGEGKCVGDELESKIQVEDEDEDEAADLLAGCAAVLAARGEQCGGGRGRRGLRPSLCSQANEEAGGERQEAGKGKEESERGREFPSSLFSGLSPQHRRMRMSPAKRMRWSAGPPPLCLLTCFTAQTHQSNARKGEQAAGGRVVGGGGGREGEHQGAAADARAQAHNLPGERVSIKSRRKEGASEGVRQATNKLQLFSPMPSRKLTVSEQSLLSPASALESFCASCETRRARKTCHLLVQLLLRHERGDVAPCLAIDPLALLSPRGACE
eukprot:763308-Hanusia_phi.AAC.3